MKIKGCGCKWGTCKYMCSSLIKNTRCLKYDNPGIECSKNINHNKKMSKTSKRNKYNNFDYLFY